MAGVIVCHSHSAQESRIDIELNSSNGKYGGMKSSSHHYRAISMLLLATLFWGISFPIMKAFLLIQQQALPGGSSWFFTAFCLVNRFGVAAIILMLWHRKTLHKITASEFQQGLGLGLFGASGLLLQMDGLAYIPASTSAFLTQLYCIIVPIFVAVTTRRSPPWIVWVSCIIVLIGVAILSQLNWRDIHLGRGETETLLGSCLFTGQILWLDRPCYAKNNTAHFTVIMFVVMALSCVPVALATMNQLTDWLTAWSSPSAALYMAVLVGACTLGSYLLMNYWQPSVTATEAGLVYCVEPVFASAYALFLPALLSKLSRIEYANETLTNNLLWGGGLIFGANILMQVMPLLSSKVLVPKQSEID